MSRKGAELVTLVDLQTMAFVADVPLDVVRAVHPGQQCVVPPHGRRGKSDPRGRRRNQPGRRMG